MRPEVYAGDEVVQLEVMREVEHGAVPTSQAYRIVSIRVYGSDGRGVFQERYACRVIQPGFCALIAKREFQRSRV